MSRSFRRLLVVAGLVLAGSTIQVAGASAFEVSVDVRATVAGQTIPVGGGVPVPIYTVCPTVNAGNTSTAAVSATACVPYLP